MYSYLVWWSWLSEQKAVLIGEPPNCYYYYFRVSIDGPDGQSCVHR